MRDTDGRRHIGSLDGLRGIAALIVVVSHFSNMATDGMGGQDFARLLGDLTAENVQIMAIASVGSGAGQFGVMIFFCLSAFLMFHLYFERPPTIQAISNFALARAIRILPLYYFSLLLTFIFFEYTSIFYIDMTGYTYLGHILFLEGASVYWTIAPELLFYAVFALLWFVLAGQRGILTILILFALVYANSFEVVWRSYALEFFLLGYVVYLYHRSGWQIGFDRIPGVVVAGLILAGGYVLLPIPHMVIFGERLALNGWQSFQLLLFTLIVFVAALENGFMRQVLSSSPARFLGDISFSLYLNHMLVLGILDHFGLIAPTVGSLALAVLASIGLSVVVYRLLERPVRRFLRRKLMEERRGTVEGPMPVPERP